MKIYIQNYNTIRLKAIWLGCKMENVNVNLFTSQTIKAIEWLPQPMGMAKTEAL